MTYALVIQAIPKLPVLVDCVLSVRPIAQLLVRYGVKKGWYLAHFVALFSVRDTSRDCFAAQQNKDIFLRFRRKDGVEIKVGIK